ncbi:uncharacterized protein RCC_11359 [Ramularia collo-cygni]|uniref:Methyltransferase type 11 domain-containing protein n=1 Tax=Ramularia collo-cygni TaxID=112498 RepID=A0A2D3VHS3_9PEZI|nr:uncharacterized protein RCC_11359 [Ramularia collo-cygni]CZT25690.1 uncharacterized protein RCC_11359 [Ramularia collo-cygni]
MTPDDEHNLSPSETSRLERQQKYITNALGFVLHSTVRRSLAGDDLGIKRFRVAVVSDTPINLDEDPAIDKPWSTLSPTQMTSSTGVAPESAEQFDVVVVNLLHTSMGVDDWETTIQNMTDLLRPGGWVQWVDWDPITARIAGSTPGTPDASNLRAFLRNYTDVIQARNVGSTYRISTMLKSHGFVERDSDMYPVAPDIGLTRVVAEGALDYLERTGNLSREEVRAAEANIEQEIRVSGPLVWYDLWCHIAQKPTKS